MDLLTSPKHGIYGHMVKRSPGKEDAVWE